MKHYILDGTIPIVCDDWNTWGEWMFGNETNRRVALDYVDEIRISTVFLGVDHGFGSSPLLFETLVFLSDDPGETGSMLRYYTWDEAIAGHQMIVNEVRAYQESAGDHASSLLGHLRAVIK